MNDTMLIGVLVAASVGFIIYALWPRQPDERKQILRRMSGQKGGGPSDVGPEAGRSSAARQMLDRVAPYAIRPVMPKSDAAMSTLRAKLAQAGFRQESATKYFLASKTIAGVGLVLLSVALGLARGGETKQVFGMAAFLGGMGFMFPNAWLWLARQQRAEKIRNGLPDSLDLLVVSVESGLALDAGIQRVSDEMGHVHADLSEELQIATLETRLQDRGW